MSNFENRHTQQINTSSKFQSNVQATSATTTIIPLNLINLNTDGKVQNPLTGIYIYADGRLATKLRKEGILDSNTAPSDQQNKRTSAHRNTDPSDQHSNHPSDQHSNHLGDQHSNYPSDQQTNHPPRITSKKTKFVVNKITREDMLDNQPIDQGINHSHNHYHVNFQSKQH